MGFNQIPSSLEWKLIPIWIILLLLLLMADQSRHDLGVRMIGFSICMVGYVFRMYVKNSRITGSKLDKD